MIEKEVYAIVYALNKNGITIWMKPNLGLKLIINR